MSNKISYLNQSIKKLLHLLLCA